MTFNTPGGDILQGDLGMEKIIFKDDPYKMNWLRQDFDYGKVTGPDMLDYRTVSYEDGDFIYTEIYMTNKGTKPYFSYTGAISIAFPLMDKYEDSRTCLTKRCHAHIFCGGNVSYIMALRMGGAAPHLGMVLTEGSLSGYSIQRNVLNQSNDRGCFLLHPSAMEFAPGETECIRWTIFKHEGKADFVKKLAEYSRYVHVTAERYVVFPGETIRVTVAPSFVAKQVMLDGRELLRGAEEPVEEPFGVGREPFQAGREQFQAGPESFQAGQVPFQAGQEQTGKTLAQYGLGAADGSMAGENQVYMYEFTAREPGEKVFHVAVDGICTWCRILVQERPEQLAGKRCRFIVNKQQYHGPLSQLAGAYLAYDNEEQRLVYTPENDYNGGRERVGMGALMAKYLQLYGSSLEGVNDSDTLKKSLKEYEAYALRELADVTAGKVYNDIGRDDSFKRLYNAPWFIVFLVELYELYKDKKYLTDACRCVRVFYEEGGFDFYPISLPVVELYQALMKAQMPEMAEEMKRLFTRHAERIRALGVFYPPSGSEL